MKHTYGRLPGERQPSVTVLGWAIRTSPVLLSCLSLVTALGLWTLQPGPAGKKPVTPGEPREPQVHYVTPRQLTSTAALAATTVSVLTATTDSDQRFTWPAPDDRRPLLLVFIKKGCPCSVEMEPFFHRLAHAYGDVVHFAGVIDADVNTAQRYAEASATPYPILADEAQQIIHRFQAENGAYVALVALHETPGAQGAPAINSIWPGCSAEMFIQIGRRIAAAAGVAERPLDASGLPSAPVTGCPFAP
jgi:peroxiredoxin